MEYTKENILTKIMYFFSVEYYIKIHNRKFTNEILN